MSKKNYKLFKIILLSLLVLVIGFKDFNNKNSNPKMTIEQVLQEEEKNIIKEEKELK